jgi:hypothetical protein
MTDDHDTTAIPDFKVVPSSANESKSNKRVSSRFLAVTCRNSEDALILCKKLVAAYSTLPTPIDFSLGMFVPVNAKFTDLELFRKLHLKGHFFGVWSNPVARGTGFLQFGLTIRHF